jgi:hypothetical protein
MAVEQVTFEVTTTSEPIGSAQDAAQVPQITVNGNPFPEPANKPYTPSGWQVAVINAASDLTSPESILSNQFTPLPDDGGEWGVWQAMYEQVVTQVLASGDPVQQIVIVSSYGLDANVPPTNDALELLLGFGAGANLQGWVVDPNLTPGSEGSGWTNTPVNYILIGSSYLGYGLGTEGFAMGGSSPITTTANATFANPVPPTNAPAKAD